MDTGEYSELHDKHVELWGTQSPADFVSPLKEEIVVREDPLPWGWNQYFDENGMPPPPPPPRLGPSVIL